MIVMYLVFYNIGTHILGVSTASVGLPTYAFGTLALITAGFVIGLIHHKEVELARLDDE